MTFAESNLRLPQFGFDAFNADFDCVSTSGGGCGSKSRANDFSNLAHFVAKGFNVLCSGFKRFVEIVNVAKNRKFEGTTASH